MDLTSKLSHIYNNNNNNTDTLMKQRHPSQNILKCLNELLNCPLKLINSVSEVLWMWYKIVVCHSEILYPCVFVLLKLYVISGLCLYCEYIPMNEHVCVCARAWNEQSSASYVKLILFLLLFVFFLFRS